MSGALDAPIVVVGMHRSGTSLVAGVLHSCGIGMGERLMPPNQGNPRGYFEDLDFVELHMQALERAGHHTDGWTTARDVPFDDASLEQASALVQSRSAAGAPWGWKDPRTVLFLEAWSMLVPEARFAVVFRAPWDVVQSLRRVGHGALEDNPGIMLRMWLHYNTLLRDLSLQRKDRCFLFSASELVSRPEAWCHEMQKRLWPGATWGPGTLDAIDRTALHSEDVPEEIADSLPEWHAALDLHRELETLAWHANR